VQNTVFAAEQVLQGSHLNEVTLAPIVVAITTLICLDQHERAAAPCKRLLNEAAGRHIPTWQAVFSALYAVIRLRQGNLACAKEHASAALTLISPRGWGVAICVPLGTTLLATTMMGEYQDAASYLGTGVPEHMFRTPFALHYLHARGKYHLATSNFRTALADFQTCGDLMIRWGLDLPSLVPWRTGAAEACLGLGWEQLAREFTDQQLAQARAEQHRTRAISLRMRAAVTEVKSRAVLLREAIDLLNRCGDRAELALAFADLSQAYDVLGEARQARMMARRARHLADQSGVRLDRCAVAEVSEPEPGDVTVKPSGGLPADLSDAQVRVAALAAQGYTNRQIASKLFITVSTVEQHLTGVYRKLNINRRTDLPLGFQIGAIA
jgi:DNA-binding CsgD family transcriptional regulator